MRAHVAQCQVSIYLDYLPGHSDEEHEAEVQVQAEAEEPKVKG
jgi:hypothetical protein